MRQAFRPGEHTKTGLFRHLPLELSLVDDLPVNVNSSRSRQPLGGTPTMFGYFMDDNAYNREGEAFWVRGESRADLILRAPVVTEATGAGDIVRPLSIRRMTFALETGPKANRVTIHTGAATEVLELTANDSRVVTLPMHAGLPYKPFPEFPTNYVYALSVESETGLMPLFESESRDNRFLGIRVQMTPLYKGGPVPATAERRPK